MKRAMLIATLVTACLSACSHQPTRVEVEEATLAEDGTYLVKLSGEESDRSVVQPRYIITPQGRFVRGEELVNETIWKVAQWPTPKENILRAFQGNYYLESKKKEHQ